MAENDVGDEIAALTAEVERLRALVGPSEEDYLKLRLDVLGARDAVITAEAEVGEQRARNQLLDTELARARRDFLWMREQVVVKAKSLRGRTPAVGRFVGRLTSR